MNEGKYLYCVINSSEEREFGPIGIGDRRDIVHSVAFRDTAILLSDSPVKEYSISRVNMLAHQKVMEMMMQSYTILPVKFGTIAKGNDKDGPGDRIRKEVLERRYTELFNILKKMENKVELGVKCLWNNIEPIFAEIVDENRDIKNMKAMLAHGDPVRTRDKRATLGEKVKDALERKRLVEEAVILKDLKPLSVSLDSGLIYGDNMVTNTSFLVSKTKIEAFDKAINQVSSEYEERMKFKYVGPVPPCSFVELTIVVE